MSRISPPTAPTGEVSLRVMAMPADTNADGNIFGGWVLGQMDVAGAMHAIRHTIYRVATVSVDGMTFYKPIYVGDEVSCYTRITGVGRTSLTMIVETWVRRSRLGEPVHVTSGTFTYVALDENGLPVEIANKKF